MEVRKTIKKLIAYVCVFVMVITSTVEYPIKVNAADVPDGYTVQEDGWVTLGEAIATAPNEENPPASKWTIYSNSLYTATSIATKGGSDTDDTISIFALKNETKTDWGIQLVRVFHNLKPGAQYDWTIDYTVNGVADSVSKSETADEDGNIVVLILLGDILGEGEIFEVTSAAAKEVDVEAAAKAEARLVSDDNIAKGKTAFASSEIAPGGPEGPAVNIVDGSLTTRWIAQTNNAEEYVGVDLGKLYDVSSIALKWDGAYASEYEIQVSAEGKSYSTVKSVKAIRNETLEIAFDKAVEARYVRVLCKKAGTEWNNSICEMGVFGEAKEEDPTTEKETETESATIKPTETETITNKPTETETESATDEPTEQETEDENNLLSGVTWEAAIGTWLGAYGEISQNNGVITVAMTRAGGGWEDAVWGVQAMADHVAVTAGAGYKFTARLLATENRKVRIKILNTDNSEIVYDTIQLTANTPYDYTALFVAPRGAIKIVYGLGAGSTDEDNAQAYTLTIRENKLVSAIVETTTPEEKTTTSNVNETTSGIDESSSENISESTISGIDETTSINMNESTTADMDESTSEGLGEETTSVTEMQLPAVPQGLVYAGTSEVPYRFTWIGEADSYNVYVNGIFAVATAVNSVEIDASYFAEIGDYEIAVTAVNEAGESQKATLIYTKAETDKPTTSNVDASTTEGLDAPTTVAVDESITGDVDEPTTGDVDEPTTEDEDKTTTAEQVEATTGEENKPTTKETEVPTTGVADEPTTESADEPTTGSVEESTTRGEEIPTTGAVEEPTTETIVETTTGEEAVLTTGDMNESTTAASVTTASLETTTMPVSVAPTTKTSAVVKVSIPKAKVKKVTKKKASTKTKISLKKIRGVRYEVKVSITKKFKKKNTVTRNVKKAVLIITGKKFKNRKVLYVKARAYRVVNGNTYYGKWSNTKKVKAK